MPAVAGSARPTRYRITVKGVVQGVGFRPFVKRLADRLEIRGIVYNNAEGVFIEIETAAEEKAREFLRALRSDAPPIAHIESCEMATLAESVGYESFTIASSRATAGDFTLTSPDVATCQQCLSEIFDPADRRYRHAFTNCTNCGPRFSITRRVPYDRPNTTMGAFILCAECAAEYASPADRRFHAEPNACPKCGPQLELVRADTRVTEPPASASGSPDPIDETLNLLRDGRIVAIKSLGGFQLSCDAFSASAVDLLRSRKRRGRKPFAVMMRDVETVEKFCVLSAAERGLLSARTAPIVLLQMRQPAPFPPALAPGLRELGVMLPYTPLHHLLFDGDLSALVMTSGNTSEEPIVISNSEAAEKLAPLADAQLVHNRDIFMRVDDSVVRHYGGSERLLRRARGYAPSALDLGFETGCVLATGAELKNTFCITKGVYAILSQHIGDLENYETLQFFEESLCNLKQVYRAEPAVIAHDLHPDYITTRWAESQPQPRIAVQHHHAHIASCMAEHGLKGKVIGVAMDGTGYGTDGQVWGGEFLICDSGATDSRGAAHSAESRSRSMPRPATGALIGDGATFQRAAHLRYVPLIGGDRAAREGWRMAAAYLHDALGADYKRLDLPLFAETSPANWTIFDQLLTRRGNILTSSCGRLFDAVSSITGVCHASSYEGEAAMLLETAIGGSASGEYPFVFDGAEVDLRPAIREIAREAATGRAAGAISDDFHSTLAVAIERACLDLREHYGIDRVCLSGGTFQNSTLLGRATARLERAGFQVYSHSRVPTNDGGIALGQAFVAAILTQQGKS